tara:strand:+ start:106706 stop:111988 length:5283 start_codon:yes stop_codon:yes gene_type:complete
VPKGQGEVSTGLLDIFPLKKVTLKTENLVEMTTSKYLKTLQNKLLDLTYRNRLLNFKYSTKSTLRVVNEIPHFLFEKLRNDTSLTFVAVPEPKDKEFVDGVVKVKDKSDPSRETEVPSKIRPPIKEYAEKLGINPSFELDKSHEGKTAKAFVDNDIQTLLYPDELERTLTRIYGLAKSAIEETGNNLLHATFGALEYSDSDTSQEKRISPLVVVPVEIVRTKPKTGDPFYSFVISSSSEGPTPNISLIEKMKSDFGINFPTVNFDASDEEGIVVDSLENYLSLVEEIIKKAKPLWKVKSEVNLCILNFGKLVLHRDLDPDNWAGTKISDHPLIRNLVTGIGDVSSESTGGFADDHPIDKVSPKLLPRLIFDADSSQHSAMVDVFARKSVVIEGPPGTGKSQTITNIIAAAIGEGKHVLFIAEKLAALKVVKKRLDEAGLGEFCLELHSTKIQKRTVLDSLKRRITTNFKSPGQIHLVRTNFEESKDLVNDYVSTIGKVPTGVRESYLQCVGKYSSLKSTLEDIGFDNVESFDARVEVPEVFDELKFVRELDYVRDFSFLLGEITLKYGEPKRHPWALKGLYSYSKLKNQSLVKEIEKINIKIGELEATVEVLNCAKYDVTGERFHRNLDLYLQVILDTKSVRIGFLTENISVLESIEFVAIKDFSGKLSDFIKIGNAADRKKLNELIPMNVSAGDIAFSEQISSEMPEYSEMKISDLSGLNRVVDNLTKDLIFISSLVQGIDCDILNQAEFGSENIRIFEELIDRSKNFVRNYPEKLEQSLLFLPDSISVRELSDLVHRNIDLKNSIEGVFLSTTFEYNMDQVIEKLNNLQSANWFNCLFIKKYSEARDWLKRNLIDSSDLSYSKNSVALNKLRQYLIFKSEIEQKPIFIKLAQHQSEISTANLHDLLVRISDLKEIHNLFGKMGASEDLVPSTLKRLGICEKVSPSFVELVVASEKSLIQLKIARPKFVETNSLITSLAITKEKLEKFFKWNLTAKLMEYRLSDIREPLEIVVQYGELKTKVDSASESYERFHFSTTEPVKLLSELNSLIAYVEKIKGFEINETEENQFFSPKTISFLNTFELELTDIQNARLEVFKFCNDLGILRFDIEAVGFCKFAEAIERALENKETLYEYENYVEIREKLNSTIYASVIPKITKIPTNPNGLRTLCEFIFYRSVLHNHIAKNNSLSYFDSGRHELVREKFRTLDKELINLNRTEIAYQLSRQIVPKGNSTGKRGTWTQLALIEREVEKVQRHIPLRQLVKRSGDALQALKPCFMMSPLTVAQFLPPGVIDFDLVVIDEASQIKPEDAFGAIARAKQVVVVGDTKQLPPTSFFDSNMEDSEDVEEEFESILEQAAGTFRPARRLRWHYRSKHESLIAFSNSQFYDNDLVLFPSATAKHEDLGVKLRKIPSGIYEGSGKNLIEAQAVVSAVKDHAHRHSRRSLGVVTMNIAQKELIDDLLYNECKSDPILSRFVNGDEGTSEEFFVKNLESVQGDEKDVIFISVTYGRDKVGAFHLRFGPINSKNGYRRLNVLFSRAKERMEVFCSFEPGLIPANSSRGANALRDFLEFAETGELKTSILETGRSFDSPFEMSVANALERRGYMVKAQVGVAGYYLDIGIQNPTKPGEFILGIECDGATYHSSKSARDRDRLRQENLEKLGWKIHRIWSTDWFRNERREIESVIRKIESILGNQEKKAINISERIDFSKLTSFKQELKKMLVNLREQINNDLPQVPPENGILRKRVLDCRISAIMYQ